MKHEPVFITEPFGPTYNIAGAALDKHRRIALKRGSVMAMTKAERWAYGEAIEKAVLAAQRSALQRELPTHAVHCASGCSSPDGIGDHMRRKQRAELLAAPAQERRARTPDQWREMYARAMEQKAKAEEARIPVEGMTPDGFVDDGVDHYALSNGISGVFPDGTRFNND